MSSVSIETIASLVLLLDTGNELEHTSECLTNKGSLHCDCGVLSMSELSDDITRDAMDGDGTARPLKVPYAQIVALRKAIDSLDAQSQNWIPYITSHMENAQ